MNWLITAVLIICLIVLLNIAGPLKGTSSSDFSDILKPKNNPFQPCPGSPNCARISAHFNVDTLKLFNILPQVFEKMNAESISSDSQTLQMEAVFRIPVFGFRDDMSVRVDPADGHGQSVLHVSSRSRVGRGDLGVNRRRIKTFLRILNSHLT